MWCLQALALYEFDVDHGFKQVALQSLSRTGEFAHEFMKEAVQSLLPQSETPKTLHILNLYGTELRNHSFFPLTMTGYFRVKDNYSIITHREILQSQQYARNNYIFAIILLLETKVHDYRRVLARCVWKSCLGKRSPTTYC